MVKMKWAYEPEPLNLRSDPTICEVSILGQITKNRNKNHK